MKILILRFSSIGDIVLTTPVIRCLKKQLPETEIHYLTKSSYASILEVNPYINQVISFEKKLDEVIPQLKKEKYDVIIDLHKNIRTAKLKSALRIKSHSFNKLNIEKWIAVKTKQKNILPTQHIVDRYLNTVKKLGVVNDSEGLDFFLKEDDNIQLPAELKSGFIAFALGAQYATKRLPLEKIISICSKINHPLVLLGGKEDFETGENIKTNLSSKNIFNYCGQLSLGQSASIVKQSTVVLTHDTGLMHIAAAFHLPIVSVWGNTIPEFGMYPYLPNEKSLFDIVEVKNLKCRPCSKIGFQSCPKKHFDCMLKQDENKIVELIEQRF